MDMTHQDRSSYFKGLLLLIRKDKVVTTEEKELMLRIGKVLGFDREFCENAIDDVLDNPHLGESCPMFSSQEVARTFLLDGIAISFVDHDVIHPSEKDWLFKAAIQNGVDADWFAEEVYRPRVQTPLDRMLEVERIAKRGLLSRPT